MWMIYKFLSTNSTLDSYYTTEDVHQMRWFGDGDEEIERFLNFWMETLEGLRYQLGDAEEADILYDKMKGFNAFTTELKAYKTASHSTPNGNNHTHEFLFVAMENHVADSRGSKNREQRREAMKAKVNTAASPNAASASVAGGTKNKNKNETKALASVIDKLTNVCSTLATGRTVQEPDYLTSVAAFATVQKSKNALEYKPFDPTRVKGGKVCLLHLTYGCDAGDSCPFYHCKQKRVCVAFNTKEGCAKKGNCSYSHELIGKETCAGILKFAEQKAAQNKSNDKKGTPKGGGKGKGAPSKGSGGGKGKAPAAKGDSAGSSTDKVKNIPCRYYKKDDASACSRGDKCPFLHAERRE